MSTLDGSLFTLAVALFSTEPRARHLPTYETARDLLTAFVRMPNSIVSAPDVSDADQALVRESRGTLPRLVAETRGANGGDEVALAAFAGVAQALQQYDALVIPIGEDRHAPLIDQFVERVRRLRVDVVTILPPTSPVNGWTVRHPDADLIDVIESRQVWPGALIYAKSGEAGFLPLQEAGMFLTALAESEPEGRPARVAAELAKPRNPARQRIRTLLQLSDLHFGDPSTEHAAHYLMTELQRHLPAIDQVVITGDVLESPSDDAYRFFRFFFENLSAMTPRRPILVPGNHDERFHGLRMGRAGVSLEQLVDLHADDLVVIDDLQLLVACLDSNRTGDIARGGIETRQLRELTTRMANVARPRNDLPGFLRVAALHHHPFPYEEDLEITLLNPRKWAFNEKLIALENSDVFLDWCVNASVGLVLHGHRHLPRLVVDQSRATRAGQPLLALGCGSSLGVRSSPMTFNIVRFDPDTSLWNAQVYGDTSGGGFLPLALRTSTVVPAVPE